MNDQVVSMPIEALRENWQKLKSALIECDDIGVDFFQKTFQSTEQSLRQCINANAVSKEYIPLIVDAYAFVDAEAGDANVQTQAAKILTERMLYQYTVNTNVNEQNASCVAIYILKSKRPIVIDFSNVEEAFLTLVETLQL